MPACIASHARDGQPFRINHVIRRDDGDVAVLTIRRPRVLNALNDDVYTRSWPRTPSRWVPIRRLPPWVLTGFGPKAFVSGADVNFWRRSGPGRRVATSSARSQAGNLLESTGKPSGLRPQRHGVRWGQ